MIDYSKQIEAFRDQKVRLPGPFKDKLLGHRKSNRDRLILRLPERIPGLNITTSSFKPQGSTAIDTIIQTKFIIEEYDIDDGIVLWRHELVDEDGNWLSPLQAKEHVRKALKDKRFAKQPRIFTNAVRVFYKDSDEEKHHVDFPVYRKFYNEEGAIVRELASENEWVKSDPTQVNIWFLGEVQRRNTSVDGRGTQLRHLTQLTKRFCRSRFSWDMPNGMKLTMLVAECQSSYDPRIDVAFREMLKAMDTRLTQSKVIKNLAHPDKPPLTRGESDENVEDLHERIREALDRLDSLDEETEDNTKAARDVWDWVFQSNGFFRKFDDEEDAKTKKAAALHKVHSLLSTGTARTSSTGLIGAVGVPNLSHRFDGEDY